jgi:hypothetical protein
MLHDPRMERTKRVVVRCAGDGGLGKGRFWFWVMFM